MQQIFQNQTVHQKAKLELVSSFFWMIFFFKFEDFFQLFSAWTKRELGTSFHG